MPATPRRPLRLLEALLLALFCGPGVVLFLVNTPIVNNLPFAWHPLILPLREAVVTNTRAYLLSAQYLLYLLACLALVAALWRGHRRWAVAVLLYGLVGAAGVGQFFPFWCRWTVLGLAALLIWRGRVATGCLLLCASLLAELALVAGLLCMYGYLVSGVHPGAVAVLLLGAALAAAQLWHRRLLPLLPALGLAALGLIGAVYGPAVARHHDGPPAAGQCQDLDVTLYPLPHRGDEHRPAWVVTEGPRGIYVAGLEYLLHLSDRGEVLHRAQLHQVSRIQDLALHEGGVLAAGSDKVMHWVPGRPPRQIAALDSFGEPMVEFGFVAAAGRRLLGAGLLYPLLLRFDNNKSYYFGELETPVFVGVGQTAATGGLYVWDAGGIGALDPEQLTLDRWRRFAPHRLAVSVHFGARRLYRARAYTHAVDMVDGQTLALIRSIPTPHAPRFLATSPDERVLASSDMMGQRLVLFSLDTGRQLASYRVGPRPRGVAYSRRLGRFMGVSACGFYLAPPTAPPPASGR